MRFARVWGYLFDCAPEGRYGGSGISWPYERIARVKTSKPVLVAGGLDPTNVAAAIADSGADIVDVCPGVESRPGLKSFELMKRFVNEVRNVQEAS